MKKVGYQPENDRIYLLTCCGKTDKVLCGERYDCHQTYNEKYVDMMDAGIVDPTKVTRSALQNATSVASTLLTTESVVASIKEDTPAMPAGGAGGMGMM